MAAINLPHVLAEAQSTFERYERALVGNNIAVLDKLFRNGPHTLRYGASENLDSYEAIHAFRTRRPATGLARDVMRTQVDLWRELRDHPSGISPRRTRRPPEPDMDAYAARLARSGRPC